ncbi:hypothetical protein RB653_008994 [Dictyostelium firmibasis]|uniref:Right handed beta helix domain-containing protein n=1 Tax=Dictyostelium firmibasis TaxID=79012 RepID=A0AAN7U1I5_9MYCE
MYRLLIKILVFISIICGAVNSIGITTVIVDINKNNYYPKYGKCGTPDLTCNNIQDAIYYFNRISPNTYQQLNLLLNDGVYNNTNNFIDNKKLNATISPITFGSVNVVFDGSKGTKSQDTLFSFTDSTISITGIQFVNFQSKSSIIKSESGDIYIDQCNFKYISSKDGSIYLKNSNGLILNSIFTSNVVQQTSDSASVISFFTNYKNKFTISKCQFNDNIALNGGAIYAKNTAILTVDNPPLSTIQNTLFNGNVATGMGGALYIDNIPLIVTSNVFTNNTSPRGSIINLNNALMNITSSSFFSGTSLNYFLSTIIYTTKSILNIDKSTFDRSFSVAINCDSSTVVTQNNNLSLRLICYNCVSIIEGVQDCKGVPK